MGPGYKATPYKKSNVKGGDNNGKNREYHARKD